MGTPPVQLTVPSLHWEDGANSTSLSNKILFRPDSAQRSDALWQAKPSLVHDYVEKRWERGKQHRAAVDGEEQLEEVNGVLEGEEMKDIIYIICTYVYV